MKFNNQLNKSRGIKSLRFIIVFFAMLLPLLAVSVMPVYAKFGGYRSYSTYNSYNRNNYYRQQQQQRQQQALQQQRREQQAQIRRQQEQARQQRQIAQEQRRRQQQVLQERQRQMRQQMQARQQAAISKRQNIIKKQKQAQQRLGSNKITAAATKSKLLSRQRMIDQQRKHTYRQERLAKLKKQIRDKKDRNKKTRDSKEKVTLASLTSLNQSVSNSLQSKSALGEKYSLKKFKEDRNVRPAKGFTTAKLDKLRSETQRKIKLANALSAKKAINKSAADKKSNANTAGKKNFRRCTTGKCDCASALSGDAKVKTTAGYKPIRDLTPGKDIVWAKNEFSGEEGWKPITDKFSKLENKDTRYITMENPVTGESQTLLTDDRHPFFTGSFNSASPFDDTDLSDRWIEAQALEVGDNLINDAGDIVKIADIRDNVIPTDTYNITVSDFHTYYAMAGTDAVWMHNCDNSSKIAGVKKKRPKSKVISLAKSKKSASNLSDLKVLRPEAKYLKSRKHGIKWEEGPATAKKTGLPQGQWGSKSDLVFAGKKAGLLKPGEGGWFNLPSNSKSVVHLPNGTTVLAKRFWVRNNGSGTFHGYPAE